MSEHDHVSFSHPRARVTNTVVVPATALLPFTNTSLIRHDHGSFPTALTPRAAKVVRKTARMHGTPIYIWKNGKVVAEKP
jgi:hypothetical protein